MKISKFKYIENKLKIVNQSIKLFFNKQYFFRREEFIKSEIKAKRKEFI